MFLTTLLHSFTYGFVAGATLSFFGPRAPGDYGFLVNFMMSPILGASTGAAAVPVATTLYGLNHALALDTVNAKPTIVAAAVGISAIGHLIYINKRW